MDGVDETKNLDGQENESDAKDDIIIKGSDADADDTDDPNKDDADDSDSDESGSHTSDGGGEGNDDGGDTKDKINQEAVNKRINKLYSEKKIAEKQAETDRQENAKLHERIAALTKKVLPAIPDVPGPMDPDYVAKMAHRDGVIKSHGAAETEAKSLADKQKSADRKIQDADKEYANTVVETFETNIKVMKLDKESMDKSSIIVGAAIPGKTNLARHLLAAKDGPLSVMYLSQAANAGELDKISKMSEVDAAVYIATTIAPKAASLKPKTSKTPKPTYIPRGRVKVTGEDPRIEGSTFE